MIRGCGWAKPIHALPLNSCDEEIAQYPVPSSVELNQSQPK